MVCGWLLRRPKTSRGLKAPCPRRAFYIRSSLSISFLGNSAKELALRTCNYYLWAWKGSRGSVSWKWWGSPHICPSMHVVWDTAWRTQHKGCPAVRDWRRKYHPGPVVGSVSTIHGRINPDCEGPVRARVRHWRLQQRKGHAQGTALFSSLFHLWSPAFRAPLDDTENWGANSQPFLWSPFTSLARQQAKLSLKKVIKNIKSNSSRCSKFPFIKSTFICQIWFIFANHLPNLFLNWAK